MAPSSPNSTQALTKNILFAIHGSGVTKAKLAAELNIAPRTFTRRLERGGFSIGEIELIAAATGSTLHNLLPDEAQATA